ncbi:MAG: DUF389 domain-containing protein [Gordonibacter sp.]|uniref:DUF389 domain-containing protein n=1 Tax=Gordonibacter sp. TaxID=1968902 RepID=UPI002FC6C0D4
MSVVSRIFAGGKTNAERIPEIERITLVRVDNPVKQYSAFLLCLVLSAVIATCGIAAESSAIVIGAMLIAPLMSPMIGTSFAIATGKRRQAARGLLVALSGAAAVVAVAGVTSLAIPAGVPLVGNGEVSSRVSPRLVDLVAAVASGAVGALAVGRDDVFDAIPGVAISVSIVPPLCVAGAALAQGTQAVASGALLLFTVNFFAIQLSCNAVFFLMGFAGHAQGGSSAKARLLWYATAVVGTVLLAVPLAAASNEVIEQYSFERGAAQSVREWLRESSYEPVSVDASNDAVVVEIAGEGTLPDLDDLRILLRESKVPVEDVKMRVTRQYS